jgi:hypothetical protein
MTNRLCSAERTSEPSGAVPSKQDSGADDLSAHLIPLARCRELLGAEAEELSDDQIDLVRRHADAMAHAVLEAFLENRPTGG